MTKERIWLIIGLASLAVLGVVALQTKLTMRAIRANEEAFDKNVQNTLSNVATKIEESARESDVLLVVNGYSTDYIDVNDVVGDESPLNGGISIPMDLQDDDTYADRLIASLVQKQRRDATLANDLGIDKDKYSFDLLPVNRDLEQRIDIAELAEVLKQELENHAINTPYEYGVYSTQRKGFVIHNDQPAATRRNASNVLQYQVLANSPYGVTFFEDVPGEPAGYLKIHFPEKAGVLWSTLLPSFVGTFLLAFLILACFGYTIYVILHQKRLSEMKTDFINNMTHEFKTPIATISLAADSISNPKISGQVDKVLRFVNIIKQENKRMNSQVEKVLQMAQIDRGDSQLRLTSVNMHEVASRAVENISLLVEPRGGQAKAVLNAGQPEIEGDLTHLSNVVNNLLDNANKYSPETPQITVTVDDHEDGVLLSVRDEGMGMSKETRKYIFDKFYRVHTGDVHDVKGFGLGLSYVKAIIQRHHGSVEVKSELGKGSEFIILLPRKQAPTAQMMN